MAMSGHRNYKLLFGVLHVVVLTCAVVALVVAFVTLQKLHGVQVELGASEKQAYRDNETARSASIGQLVGQVCRAVNCCIEIFVT